MAEFVDVTLKRTKGAAPLDFFVRSAKMPKTANNCLKLLELSRVVEICQELSIVVKSCQESSNNFKKIKTFNFFLLFDSCMREKHPNIVGDSVNKVCKKLPKISKSCQKL